MLDTLSSSILLIYSVKMYNNYIQPQHNGWSCWKPLNLLTVSYINQALMKNLRLIYSVFKLWHFSTKNIPNRSASFLGRSFSKQRELCLEDTLKLVRTTIFWVILGRTLYILRYILYVNRYKVYKAHQLWGRYMNVYTICAKARVSLIIASCSCLSNSTACFLKV